MAASVYEFTDYRRYLERWLKERKSRSVRALAAEIGCSPAYISMVRKRARSLNVEHARQWGTALGLDPHELDYWEHLVAMEHAPQEEERLAARRQVGAVQAYRKALLSVAGGRERSQWYVSTIREFARCAGFRMDPVWIAQRLRPPVTVEQAAHALEILTRLGSLVERDGVVEVRQSGATPPTVEDRVASVALSRTHRYWLGRCEQLLQEGAPPRIRTAAFALDADRLDEVTMKLTRLLIEAAEAGNSHRPTVSYKIMLAVVPRSARTDGE